MPIPNPDTVPSLRPILPQAATNPPAIGARDRSPPLRSLLRRESPNPAPAPNPVRSLNSEAAPGLLPCPCVDQATNPKRQLHSIGARVSLHYWPIPITNRWMKRRWPAAWHVPPEEAAAFAEFLVAEEKVGRVMQVRHSLYVLPKRLGFCVGHLQMNERGFGFLVPTTPAEPDFYVAAEDTGTPSTAILVLARLKEQRGGRQRDSRLRGEVVKVLQRKRRQLVGTLRQTPMFYFVLPDESRIPHDICVPPPTDPSSLGQKVVVELKDWPDRRKPPEGVITEVLGAPDAPGVDLLSIIRKHDLPTSFPEKVEQEAAAIAALIPPEEIARREDFRKIFTLTIDPDDAKDFDDALSYRIAAQRRFRDLHPHRRRLPLCADRLGARHRSPRRAATAFTSSTGSSRCCRKSSATASARCNRMSTAWSRPPSSRSTNGAKSNRFGSPPGSSTAPKRFTYKEAFALLRKPATTPLATHVHALNAMAQVLRKRRFAKGALDLDFPEVKVRVDELGMPTHLEKTENDISHQFIEEFMLLANEVVALELKRRSRPGLYRVHENPDPVRLEEFRAQAKSMGFSCGDLTQRGEIQKLLNKVRGQPGESVVKIGLLKSLKRAMYSPKPLGHYGLAKMNYTHFTSPIRRYSDLVVHRLLFGHPRDTADFNFDALARLCLHLSTTERSAAEAEQESVKLKKLEYFDRQAHATKRTSFQAPDPGSPLLWTSRPAPRIRRAGHGTPLSIGGGSLRLQPPQPRAPRPAHENCAPRRTVASG